MNRLQKLIIVYSLALGVSMFSCALILDIKTMFLVLFFGGLLGHMALETDLQQQLTKLYKEGYDEMYNEAKKLLKKGKK